MIRTMIGTFILMTYIPFNVNAASNAFETKKRQTQQRSSLRPEDLKRCAHCLDKVIGSIKETGNVRQFLINHYDKNERTIELKWTRPQPDLTSVQMQEGLFSTIGFLFGFGIGNLSGEPAFALGGAIGLATIMTLTMRILNTEEARYKIWTDYRNSREYNLEADEVLFRFNLEAGELDLSLRNNDETKVREFTLEIPRFSIALEHFIKFNDSPQRAEKYLASSLAADLSRQR